MSNKNLWLQSFLFIVCNILLLSGCSSGNGSKSNAVADGFYIQGGVLNQLYSESIQFYTVKFESNVNICSTSSNQLMNCTMLTESTFSYGGTYSLIVNGQSVTLKHVESDFPNLICNNKNVTNDGTAYLITPYTFVTVDNKDMFSPVNYLIAMTNQCYPIWYMRIINHVGYDLKLGGDGMLIYKSRNIFNNVDVSSNTILSDNYIEEYISSINYKLINDEHDVIFNNLESYINLWHTESANVIIDESGNYGNLLYTFFGSSSEHPIFSANEYYLLSDILDMREVNYVKDGKHLTQLDHGNSIAYTNDNNFIYNSRNTSSFLKINAQNGNVIWQFGGKRNQFSVSNDPFYPIMYEHFVRQLPSGNYLLFDNGDQSRGFSRAVEYRLNESNFTAEMVWQFYDNRQIFGEYMGSAQRLDNGNTVIGYGTQNNSHLPEVQEVDSNGNVVNEIYFPNKYYTYRVYKVKLPDYYK